MTDKTILIAALGVGAYLLTRRAVASNGTSTTAAQRLFANSTQSPARVGLNPAIYDPAAKLANGQAAMFGQLGNIIGGLLGKTSSGGASLTSGEYTALGKSPAMVAEGIAYAGSGNVFDQAAASIGSNPFGLYSNDGIAGNPIAGFDQAVNSGGDIEPW